MSGSSEGGSSTTVKGHFTELVRQYKEILNGSTSSEMDAAARALIPQFEKIWHQMAVLDVFSSNEELDDLSTTSLELLWTPYIIADLYQRVQGQMPTPTPNSQTNSTASEITREEVLTCSNNWYDVFFKWMISYELVDERTLETYRKYDAENRTQRVELSRRCRELEQEMHRSEEHVQYLQAKRKRMQAIMSEDGEDMEDDGGDEEEVLRNRALARLRWSIYEACHQLQLSSRELGMLQALSPEKREAIAKAHQSTLEAVERGEKSLGRQTYTILPGGLIAVGAAAPMARLNSIAMSVIANQQAFRQQVVDELMMERNKPTMTLQEFADMEMADVQRRMDAEADARRRQEEEDERLGPEGIEERQRQRDARLADWKDDHAPNGLTAKGNYA